MNAPRKLFGIWILTTTVFTVLAVLITSFVMWRQLLAQEAESRLAYRQLVEVQVLKTYPAMAEEAYLKLGSFSLHEKAINDLLTGRGEVALTFFEDQAPNAGANAEGVIKPTWLTEAAHSDSFTIPLFFDDHFTGTLEGVIHWKVDHSSLLTRMAILIVLLVGAWLLLALVLRRQLLAKLLNEHCREERVQALTEIAQRMANDRGQPLTPADGPLYDVISLNEEASLSRQTVEVESLIDRSLGEVFSSRPHSHIQFAYSFRHTRQWNVDPEKVSRLFYLLLTKIVASMPPTGRIRFLSQDVTVSAKPSIEISLGYSGTPLSESALEVLLAAQIVRAQGGQISFLVSKSGDQQVVFTLPADPTDKAQSRLVLPTTASAYLNRRK